MGEWRQPAGAADLVAVLRSHGTVAPERLVEALVASGAIVRTEYYVPEARELFGLYRLLSWQMRDTTGVGWVMCRETRDALVEQYGPNRVRVLAPMLFSALLTMAEPGAAELESAVMTVMERGRHWSDSTMLLGLPVRVDPAARRPMLEVISNG